MLAAALGIHEYMRNFVPSRCVIGCSGTVSLSAVTHAWAVAEDRDVGRTFAAAQRSRVWG